MTLAKFSAIIIVVKKGMFSKCKHHSKMACANCVAMTESNRQVYLLPSTLHSGYLNKSVPDAGDHALIKFKHNIHYRKKK